MDKVHEKGFTYYSIVGIMVLTILAFLYSCWTNYTFTSLVRDTAEIDIAEFETKGIVANNNGILQIDSFQRTSYTDNIDDIYNQQKHNTIILLDILSKSNKLIGASELTFFFTFIVAFLSVFFGYKTIEVDQRVKDYEAKVKVCEDRANEYEKKVQYISRYNSLLARVQCIYNLSIIIKSESMLFSTNMNSSKNKSISKEMGSLCSRLSPICSEIEDRFNDRKYRWDSVTNEEKAVLDILLDDAIDELDRSEGIAQRLQDTHLYKIINNNKEKVKSIKRGMTDNLKIRDENKA